MHLIDTDVTSVVDPRGMGFLYLDNKFRVFMSVIIHDSDQWIFVSDMDHYDYGRLLCSNVKISHCFYYGRPA